MRKTLQILAHEVYLVTSRLSFWSVLLIPPISLLIFVGVTRINQSRPVGAAPFNNPFAAVGEILSPAEDARPQGYVDPGGLVRAFPTDFSAELLLAYADQTSARRALDDGKISAFYVISPDYPQSGKITAYMPQYNLTANSANAALESLINYNLLGADDALYRSVLTPIQKLEKESLAPPVNAIRENNSQAAMYICIAVMFLFFSGIFGSSTLLLNSLSSEKENRVMEVLMVSASPIQLLFGKIAGLGLVGLVQMLIWMPGTVMLLKIGGEAFKLPEELRLRPSFIGWGLLFFLLGYLVYAAIMAGIGVLVPNLREASQVTTLVMTPMLIAEALAPSIITAPHGTLAVIFSLFPLTSPMLMMMRLSMAEVPLWQLLAAIALLALTALLVIRVVAGLFRAQTILAGRKFRLSSLLKRLGRVGS